MSPYHHGAKLSSFMSPHHSMTSSSGETDLYTFSSIFHFLPFSLPFFYNQLYCNDVLFERYFRSGNHYDGLRKFCEYLLLLLVSLCIPFIISSKSIKIVYINLNLIKITTFSKLLQITIFLCCNVMSYFMFF